MSEESYARTVRLAYLSLYRTDGAKAALARAHRLARKAERRAGDGDPTAYAEGVLADPVRSGISRYPGFGPEVVPPVPTAEQNAVLDKLAALPAPLRIPVLRHILDHAELAPRTARGGSGQTGFTSAESLQNALAGVLDGRRADEIRTLLTGPELDPLFIPVGTRRLLARRGRRRRTAGAVLGALVLVTAAGGWWFGVRTQPLGSYDHDPVLVPQAAANRPNDGALDPWYSRGELLGDTALLRRAAGRWYNVSYPSQGTGWTGTDSAGAGPEILFAGRVHDVDAVVLADGRLGPNGKSASAVAVYTEPVDRNAKDADPPGLDVNPVREISVVGGIRLTSRFGGTTDSILVPPYATDVQTGPLDDPANGWTSSPPDSRGVLDVAAPPPVPGPGGGPGGNLAPVAAIRYGVPATVPSLSSVVTVAETYRDEAPLLPTVGPGYENAVVRHLPMSAGAWCAAKHEAETRDDLGRTYGDVELADIASGPLPDGAGTGYLMRRTATRGSGWFQDNALLAMSGSCDTADLTATGNLREFAADGSTLTADQWPGGVTPANSQDPVAVSIIWTSPAKKTYLIAAGTGKVAKLRVTGPVPGTAAGHWLVIPLPAVYDGTPVAEANALEAFDAQGHRCGDPVPGSSTSVYC